jgi:hypothetical protein
MNAYKGDTLDYLSKEELSRQLFEAEALEEATRTVAKMPTRIRDDKRFMQAVATQIARIALGEPKKAETYDNYDNE